MQVLKHKTYLALLPLPLTVKTLVFARILCAHSSVLALETKEIVVDVLHVDAWAPRVQSLA